MVSLSPITKIGLLIIHHILCIYIIHIWWVSMDNWFVCLRTNNISRCYNSLICLLIILINRHPSSMSFWFYLLKIVCVYRLFDMLRLQKRYEMCYYRCECGSIDHGNVSNSMDGSCCNKWKCRDIIIGSTKSIEKEINPIIIRITWKCKRLFEW